MNDQSLSEILEERGWLTLNQFVSYVKEVEPIKALSYPAMLRYVDKGLLKAEKVGGQRRISKDCIEHYLKYGTEKPYEDPNDSNENGAEPTTSESMGEVGQSTPSIPAIGKDFIPESFTISSIPEKLRPVVPPPPDDDD